MTRHRRVLATAGVLLGLIGIQPALAEKSGGVLKVYFFDSPASMSIHEEAMIAGQGPMIGVFNNLVMYKQDVPQSGLQSIVPDLASEWSWDEDRTALSFRLRQGIKWHDGKPFTAKEDKMVDRQSMEFGQSKRKELVWAVERKLAKGAARPILWHNRSGTCWHPYVKGYTPMVNSIYNGLRMEDVWLDK